MQKASMHPAAVAAFAACVALFGCGNNSAADSLSAAKTHLAKSDLPAAIIELKNSLQTKPDLAEARFLLGKALLENEDPVAAAVELRKAADLKYTADQVTPLLAMAYMQAGEPRNVIELDASSTLAEPDAIAGLKTQLAKAHTAFGSHEKAGAALAQALHANARYGPALVFRARTLAVKRDFDGAMRIADEVLARTPEDIETLMLKADLLGAKSDAAGAATLYRKVLAGKRNHLAAHAALLTQSLAAQDLTAARSQLEALKMERPGHRQAVYFEAWIASLSGDTKTATELTQALLKSASESLQVLHLAGVVALQRNELVLAEQHLGKAIQRMPEMAHSRLLLARVHMRAGDADKTLETLQPMLEAATPDAGALALAGAAYLQSGDPRRAEEFFARAAQQRPNDASSRTGLALARIARGNAVAGLSDLEAVAEGDPGTAADLALIASHWQRRDDSAALIAIDRLQTKEPGTAQPLHLRAQVLARQGDVAGARANYEKALAVEPGFYPAVDGLATLDLRENRPEQARARFNTVLKANPNDVRALIALATLDEQAGKPKQEVAASLAKAVSIKPSDPGPRRRLIEYHLSKQDHKLALAAAQEAASNLPNNPEALALLGRAQIATGEANQAQSTFNKVASLQPKSAQPHMALAALHFGAKDAPAAMRSINKALELEPDHPDVNRRAVGMAVAAGRHEDALVIAKKLQTRQPQQPLGYSLLGDIEFSRGKFDAAAGAYQTAMRIGPSGPLAVQLHRSYLEAGKRGQADAFAASWLKDHPKDGGFLFDLGSVAASAKDYPAAEARFAEAAKLQPDNAFALNNLAWVMGQLKKPGAIAHAERASQLRPNTPAFMDTWAQLLADANEVGKAIEMQKKALELAPTAHGLRLNMARLYLRAGDKAAARAELDTLAKLGDQFAQQNEVRELQGKL